MYKEKAGLPKDNIRKASQPKSSLSSQFGTGQSYTHSRGVAAGLNQNAAKRQTSGTKGFAQVPKPVVFQQRNVSKSSREEVKMINDKFLPSSQMQNKQDVLPKPSRRTNPQGLKREVFSYDSGSDSDNVMPTVEDMREQMKLISLLKGKLAERDKQVENLRRDNTRLRKENFDLKNAVQRLKDSSTRSRGEESKSNRPREVDSETDTLRQVQMAMAMNDMENRVRDRQMLMMALQMTGSSQAEDEEERLLQRALEESKQEVHDPSNPDVDNMTYEQLIDLGEKAGNVSRGCSAAQIASIRTQIWSQGKTKQDECAICFEKFTHGQKFKRLEKCGHEYHQNCIDKWLKESKKCPVCNVTLFE